MLKVVSYQYICIVTLHIAYTYTPQYTKYNIQVNKLVFKTKILNLKKEQGLITATEIRQQGAVF